MAEIENHTLVLLREMRAEFRAEMQAARTEFRAEMLSMREESNARFDRIEKRLDAMHLNGVKALRGFIAHRSMTERAMASIDDQFARLETRVAALEAQA